MFTEKFWEQIIPASIALMSSMVTLIIAHLLRNIGRIYVNTISPKLEMSVNDKGKMHKINSLIEASKASCEFEMDLYNNSNVPKGLRELVLEFSAKKSKISELVIQFFSKKSRKIISTKAYVFDKIDVTNQSIFDSGYRELKIINLPVKEMKHYQIRGSISGEDIAVIGTNFDIFFCGRYPKGRKFRTKIFTYSDDGGESQ